MVTMLLFWTCLQVDTHLKRKKKCHLVSSVAYTYVCWNITDSDFDQFFRHRHSMYMYTQEELRWKKLTWCYIFWLFAYSRLWQFSVFLFVGFSHNIITYECSILLANLLQIIYCNMYFLLACAKWKTKWLFLNIMIIFCYRLLQMHNQIHVWICSGYNYVL